MSPSQHALQFKDLDAESFFVKRLADHGRRVFDGVTDPVIRRERIRAAIIDAHLEAAIIGKTAAGKTETYSQAFERHFAQPLHVKPPKGKTSC